MYVLVHERSDREKEGREEVKERDDVDSLTCAAPRGAHADSAATSDKTGSKTSYGPKVNRFCEMRDDIYLVLRFGDDFVI